MRSDSPWLRVTAVAAAAIVITGCAGNPIEEPPLHNQQHLSDRADLEVAIAYMARAQQADDEQWLRLHQLLTRSAALRRTPSLRAYTALVLAQGQRSDEELLRAEKLMSRLLRQDGKNGGAQKTTSSLGSHMHQLVSMQHEQLLKRIALRRELAQSKVKLARAREKLSTEMAAHATTREQRHQLLVELDSTRQKLRAVTRIELRHQSDGG